LAQNNQNHAQIQAILDYDHTEFKESLKSIEVLALETPIYNDKIDLINLKIPQAQISQIQEF
jgi:hypothetical protein